MRLFIPLLSLCAACSSESNAATLDAGTRDSGATAPDSAPARACDPPSQEERETAVRFQSLSAKLVDQFGAVASDVMVTVCDSSTCLKGDVAADGALTVQSDPLDMRGPAFKVGDGLDFALLAFPLQNKLDHDLGTTIAIRLPKSGAPIAAGSESSSAGVTISLAANTVLDFDTLTYPKELQVFRVASIPMDRKPLAIDPSVESAYAMAPQQTTLCPPAALSLPNERAWPPGTAVEILAHGVEIAHGWAPYGGWSVVSTAHVTSDGAAIRTDDGQGLPVITTIGVRKK